MRLNVKDNLESDKKIKTLNGVRNFNLVKHMMNSDTG